MMLCKNPFKLKVVAVPKCVIVGGATDGTYTSPGPFSCPRNYSGKFQCGRCNRGIIHKLQVGFSCRVCKAKVLELWADHDGSVLIDENGKTYPGSGDNVGFIAGVGYINRGDMRFLDGLFMLPQEADADD